MTLDLDELERVAKRAGRRNWTDTDRQDFDDAFTPAVCLALLARARDAERLEAQIAEARKLLTIKGDEFVLRGPGFALQRARQALSALNEGGPANG